MDRHAPLAMTSYSHCKVLKAPKQSRASIAATAPSASTPVTMNRLPSIKKVTSGSTPEVSEEVDQLYQKIITAGTYKASSIRVAEAAQTSTEPVHALTGFEPFAARGMIVTDKLIHQLRDEACV